VTQYFDMMKDIGAQSKTNAVFMNHSPGALEDLAQVPYYVVAAFILATI